MSSKTLVLPFDVGNSNLDRSTILCLACSSSLPPLKTISSSSSSSPSAKLDPNSIFITNCCQRPICPSCIASNPRLARYDPCLACLGGVSVVASRSTSGFASPYAAKTPRTPDTDFNLDGSVRDEDTFVLGDDEDEDQEDGQHRQAINEHTMDNDLYSSPPPPYESAHDPFPTVDPTPSCIETTELQPKSSQDSERSVVEHLLVPNSPPADADDEDLSNALYKYYINRGDTLHGISLRFGIDSHEICKLNNLPVSVIRTMPQLLHTRAFLLLPPGAKTSQGPSSKANKPVDDRVREREEHLVRERAGKRLQTLTKEVDWNVAKAYVALVDDPHEKEAHSAKRKEMGSSGPSNHTGALETLAIQRYLEDNDWEEQERRAGRGPEVQAKPFSFSLGVNNRKTDIGATGAGSQGVKGW